MKGQLISSYLTFAREPVIRRLKDGALVCFALTGGQTEPDDKNVVVVCESLDDGKTWSTPKTLFSHPSRGCWATEIFTEGEKDFAVLYTYHAQSWYLELQTFVSFYDPIAKLWSEPKSFDGPINGCSLRQGIKISNGEYLFPLYWQKVASSFTKTADSLYDSQDFPFVCGVAISSDKGKTYQRYGHISSNLSTLWEPNVVEVEAGHMIMYCRSNCGTLYISESFDFGRTWTEGYYSDICNPNTKVSVVKVGGDILMISNFSKTKHLSGWGNRTNLAIYKSKDGKRFTKLIDVCDAEKIAFYPHAYVDYDKKQLFVAYENSKEHFLSVYTFSELGLSEK